ncbi:hypothetical protein GF369_02495 [Candidatus Peregrinibacteria bacterium]|nr:hypothetical protein [Candidatus Peregrinibacteria bacterium]
MKKHLALIANIILIILGLLGLKTPYLTDAVTALGISGFLDPALLQPLFIFLVVVAIYGQFTKARESLSFMPLILELIIGIVAFLFIFPFQNMIIGYLSLAGILYIMISPVINRYIQKKNVVKIKA